MSFSKFSLICGVSMLALPVGIANAQTAAEEDVIISTGVLAPTTVFESTASVTAVSAEQISNLAPRSINELFRSIPGIKSEDTGGDANANIKVRGLPIASGGARYLSLQENGFPTLLIGDLQFSTADSYIRSDSTVGSVQAIRGGSASTQAPNAAGGIINLISKKPTEAGGSVAATVGIDYESYRLDAEYGDVLADGTYYHVGGFVRTGEGVRDTVNNLEEGYQVKASVGKDFDRGSVAVHFKRLDDRVPTFLPLPATVGTGGEIRALNGLDLGSGTTSLGRTDIAPRLGNALDVQEEGVQSEVTSIGFEADYDLTDQFTLAAKGRWADISGNFFAPFPAGLDSTNPDGSSNINFVNFNTQVGDVGNLFGDISVNADFDNINLKAGVFYADQASNQTWGFNDARATLRNGEFITDSTGLDLTDPSNAAIDAFLNGPGFVQGVSFVNDNFGNCCSVDWNFDIEQVAPYVAATLDFDALTIDGSYRTVSNTVSGDYIFFGNNVIAPLDVNGGGIGANETRVQQFVESARIATEYDADHDTFSIGANYEVNDGLAIFGNYSEGASLTAPDRSAGSLVVDAATNTATSPDGDLFLNFVEQFEVGARFKTGLGDWSVVYFDAQVAEAAQFEVTSQSVIANTFDTNGLEIEGNFDFDNGFGVIGNLTVTDSELTNTADAGNGARRQAPFTLNVTPSYTGDNYDVGLNIFSTGAAPVQNSNQFDLPGYTTVGAYVNFNVYDNLTLSLNGNNLLDAVGFSEGEEGNPAVGDFVRFRPINGRTISATARYNF